MNKFQVIEHAKNYLDMLAAGTDPISKEPIPDDSVVSRPQLKKCFQFVSAVLQEVLQNNGLVLPDAENSNTQAPAVVPVTLNGSNYELVRKKAAFCMTQEQKNKVLISRFPITPNAFLKNINLTVNAANMEKLSIKCVNAWLKSNGYITEGKKPTVINKTVWKPTQLAQQVGFTEMDVPDANTGEMKRQLMFTSQAQQFLLAHVEEIAAIGKQAIDAK